MSGHAKALEKHDSMKEDTYFSACSYEKAVLLCLYCDRITPGENKPCNEIGSSRTYEARITANNSTMALYRKAYKTHYARILANMSFLYGKKKP